MYGALQIIGWALIVVIILAIFVLMWYIATNIPSSESIDDTPRQNIPYRVDSSPAPKPRQVAPPVKYTAMEGSGFTMADSGIPMDLQHDAIDLFNAQTGATFQVLIGQVNKGSYNLFYIYYDGIKEPVARVQLVPKEVIIYQPYFNQAMDLSDSFYSDPFG